MNYARLRAGLALSFVAVLLLGAACKRNHPPSIPDVTGRLTYRPGDTVRLSATATDLDDDSLAYLFAWVDSSSAVWTENYPSGATATGSLAYVASDTYTVRVRARDTKDAESDWSPAETLRVGIFAPGVPACPAGPSSGATGDTYRCSTSATSPYGEPVLIEYDWNGTQGGWCPAVPSDSPCIGTHVFYLAGTYHIRARAGDTTGLSSAWSNSLTVTVVLHDTTPPSVNFVSPANGDTVKRGLIAVKAVANDDQIVTKVEFTIDGTLTGTDSIAVGDTFSYAWTDTVAQVPDQSHTIVATAFDAGGNSSSVTIGITVVRSGVKWYWQNANQGSMMTSALVANDGEDEVVMSYCWEDYKFYSVRVGTGEAKCYTTTQQAEQDFSGGPALCVATGHVIVGSDEGELYALALGSLSHAWRWPDIPNETLEPYIPYGAPAINGSDIYVGRESDTDSLDRLYKFTDVGGSATPGPTYVLHGQSVIDAPAIDAAGNVIFGTDSGYLIKIDANLSSPIWRLHLIRIGEVNGPIIGSDGTVYCGTESLRLCAVNPNGTIKWTATLDGVGARPALGRSALFVGSDMGAVYSIDPATGAINWQKSFTPSHSFNTTPIVAANGCLYIQSDQDVLFCLDQSDGTLIWSCDCNSYLPGRGHSGNSPRPRKLGLTDYDPNPSLTAEGDILVVGRQALFCVSGYKDGPLDPAAAWPKWQHDLYNSGYVGGGR
jgi:outer membrane protein assembly factor BamB